MAESEEEQKSFLMKGQEESEKVALKLSFQKTKIMASGPITSWEIDGEIVSAFILGGTKITVGGNCSIKLKDTCSLGKKSYDKLVLCVLNLVTQLFPTLWGKPRWLHFADKRPSVKSKLGFSSSHVWMWELDHKESWAPKNWCLQTVVLENFLESSLDSKGIKPINSKGNQPWVFIERTDAEA